MDNDKLEIHKLYEHYLEVLLELKRVNNGGGITNNELIQFESLISELKNKLLDNINDYGKLLNQGLDTLEKCKQAEDHEASEKTSCSVEEALSSTIGESW